jgi:RimJ/RimL family protein N-acetyltransferase
MAAEATTLRPLVAGDVEMLFVEVFEGEDPDPSGYLLKDRPSTVAEVEGLVGWLVDGSSVGQLHPFLFLDDADQVVGWGLITEGGTDEAPEISFMIGPRHRGHGHAKRAAAQLAAEVLSGEATSVEAVVHVENAAVRHILAELGFAVVSDANPTTNEETWARSHD